MRKVETLPYALLTYFLGSIGIHKFYAGFKSKGIAYLAFAWTGVPGIIAFFTFLNTLFNTENGKIVLDEDGKIVPKGQITKAKSKKIKTLEQITKNETPFYQTGWFWGYMFLFTFGIPLIIFGIFMFFWLIMTVATSSGGY